MKKIRYEAHWQPFDGYKSITERLFAQYLTPEISLEGFEFVNSDDYDVGFCCNFDSLNAKDKPIYVFPHEPHWSGCHQKSFPDNVTILGFDKELYTGGKCIESHAFPFYGGMGAPYDTIDVWNYHNMTNSIFEKSKNISCSITTINREVGPTCLYPKRFKLLNSLLNEPYINLHGCTSLLDKGNNVRDGNKKIDFVSPYKFTLTIENTHSKNYITEKFYDAILTDCIPIYYGVSNLKEIHPDDGYILIPNIDDIEGIKSLLKEVNENADDIYKQKIEEARKIKQRLFKDLNPIKKIIELASI